jgi:sialic acid synthase SpsE
VTEVIAEISGNHGGSFGNAVELIVHAKQAGADAVKFQCFTPERLAARRGASSDVLDLAATNFGGAALIDLYRRVHTPQSWFPHLIAICKDVDIAWFSSVFDPLDVAFLESLDCPRYKISAFEMLDWDIIKAVRETGKPIVMSVRPRSGVTILQATDYDGRTVPLGLSAHGSITPASGTPMVEYHLKLPGVETPDSDFSLMPDDLRMKIADVRAITSAGPPSIFDR